MLTDWFWVIFTPISVLYGQGISSEIALLQSSLPNPLKPVNNGAPTTSE